MEEIKSYLCRLSKLNKVLLLSATTEFEELKQWLKNTHKALQIFDGTQGRQKVLPSKGYDAVIFDYGTGQQLLEEYGIVCDYCIGRVGQEENCFLIWEGLRSRAKSIYIKREKKKSHQALQDSPGGEILFWEGKDSDIELSVIIPVYNVADYLPACIESLISWKAPYVEYLFINDGSSDSSREIIEGYALKDRRIHVIDQKNRGCAAARNRGLEAARGRYVGFVDGDDFIEETMLQKLFFRGLAGGYDLSYCGYLEYREETGQSKPVMNDCLNEIYTEGTFRQDKVQLLAIKTRVAIWRCLYKREFLERERIRFHEELKRFDDLPFRIEVLFRAESAVCVPEYLYYYRLGRQGQDISCRDERLFVHFTIFELLDIFVDGLKERRLKDLLQIVKVHTHGYGLRLIQKEYKQEYQRRAVRQLDRNMGYLRTLCLILMHTGKTHILWYTKAKVKEIL